MGRWALVIASVAALGIAGYVLFEPVESERRSAKKATSDEAEDPKAEERRRAKRKLEAFAEGRRPPMGAPPIAAMLRPSDPAPIPKLDAPGQAESRADARSAFEAVIDRLEDLARDKDAITLSKKEALYRQASMAYAALSAELDPADAAQARYLEETRALMIVKLKAAGIEPHVPKDRPEPQRPPRPLSSGPGLCATGVGCAHMTDPFTLVTWNVNSIRARLDNVLTYLDEADADIVCLQETKVEDKLFPRVPFMQMGYTVHLNGEGGYCGVAVMTKGEATEVHRGFRHGEADKHPRILSLSVGGVRVYCLYVPNGGGTPDRAEEAFAYKLDWYARLRAELDELHTADESVLLCGDFNIAPDERDVWSVDAMQGGTHFTPVEHAALKGLTDFGLQDCYRKHSDAAGDFTWFDYRAASWERGHGLRIDHVYATPSLYARSELVRHEREPRGWETPSDHLPVFARFGAA